MVSVESPPGRVRSGSSPAPGRGRTGRGAALQRQLGQLLRGARRVGADWLDRPMTSLHLVLAVFALMLGFGLLMVLSSSSVTAFRAGGSSFSTFANQATYAAVGLICFWATQFVPVRVMRSLSTAAVIVSLALLVAVLAGFGARINGARSWIRLGGFQFQPSEIAKLALLLWMAHVLAARRSTLGSAKALLIPVLPVFCLMAGLIMLQPDLGTTVALTIVFMAVLFFAGAPWWTFAGVGAAAAAGFVYLAVSADYRLARLTSFIDPEAHPDVSYQLLQSLYGMGNGGWFGVGLGQSRAKWSYLPNADSDFIFAIVGEELGLIGAGILLLLFAVLAYTGLRIARRNVDPFVKIVASAATVWLVGQAAINIGYVVGLLPVTGIPLPMISAGGTSLLITMVVFGILANFARREPQAAAALQAGGDSRVRQFLGLRPVEKAGRPARRKFRGRVRKAPAQATTAPRRAPRGAGTPVRGADTPVRGAGTPVRGAGTPVRGAGTPVRGAGTPVRVAGNAHRTSDRHTNDRHTNDQAPGERTAGRPAPGRSSAGRPSGEPGRGGARPVRRRPR